jgi:dihydrolipoamide dehydrogenase
MKKMAKRYDLLVIGAGPGGYVASVRAAQLGMRVACIEKESALGGVCLNVGCIPSKALLDSSELYHVAQEKFAGHGLLVDKMSLDLKAMMERKSQVVQDLTGGVRKLLEANGVEIIQGSARLVGDGSVEVVYSGSGPTEKGEIFSAKSILLATGSEPIALPDLPFDGSRVFSSTEALTLESVPEHLVIIGGGYIGLELGSVWRRLGARVTVIEMMPRIASGLDGQIARFLERSLLKQGFTFRVNTRLVKTESHADGVRLTVRSGDQEDVLECDRLLVAIGRRPLTDGLGLADVGVRTDPKRGWVLVDEQYRTSVPGVYAIGDLIAGPMLAHKASAEGVAAVECIAGLPGEVNYDAIPAVVYTSPEVASVGLTEEEVKARGVAYCVGTYPFSGAGRARCMGETEGLAKIIAHAKTRRILGVHIIGQRASEMIAECALAVEFAATSEDIARTVHAHPTFSETLYEAAMAVRKCPSAS